MRRIFGLALAAMVFALATGCGKKDSTASSGTAAASLEGDWTLVGMEKAGKKMTEEEFAKVPAAAKSIKATGDKMIGSKGEKDPLNYKLNPSKSPSEIDLTSTKTNGKTETMYGIYKLEGDTLTICAVESDDPADRPKEFKTAPGSKAMIMTLKK